MTKQGRESVQNLHSLEDLYRMGVDAHSIVSVTDVKGNILHVNDLFCSISGFSRAELIGGTHRIIKSDEHPHSLFADMWYEIANGRIWHGEVKNRKKDGGFYWVKTTIVPVLNERGKPYKYISTRTDITDRKLAEAKLKDSRNKVSAALGAKSYFLSRMNHEIRTPLNGIIGMTDVLEDMELTGEQMECLEVIKDSSDHLMQLLLNLLDLENAGSGKTVMTGRMESITTYCCNLERHWQAIALTRGISFGLTLDKEVPRNMVFDAARIDRIIDELLKNAFDFTKAGGVEVTIRPGRNGRIYTEIVDSGIGMSEAILETIFEPFEQADTSYSRQYDGAGIGLALSRELVENMGGEIGVESLPGEGSTFWFELPMPRDVEDFGTMPLVQARA